MQFIFIRHGQTAFNVEGRYMGWLDTPLNVIGTLQSKLTGKYLLQNYKISHIFSSDLARARQTTKMITMHLESTPVTYFSELRERNWGDYEGMFTSDVWKHKTAEEKLKIFRAPPNGEPLDEFHRRCQQGFEKIERYKDWNGNDVIVIVSHGGTIRNILGGLFQVGQNDFGIFPIHLDNCSITIVIKKEGHHLGNYHLKIANWTNHLNSF